MRTRAVPQLNFLTFGDETPLRALCCWTTWKCVLVIWFKGVTFLEQCATLESVILLHYHEL